MTSPNKAPRTPEGRFAALDGLRGVAVLAVLLYHFGYRWAEPRHPETIYPYGEILIGIPGIAAMGQYGVYLFFVISGFVIMMTLERCSGLLDFVSRRAARLWPAMLVCATISALMVNLSGVHLRFDSLEYWGITQLEFISSVLFIDPAITGPIFGQSDAEWVEAVYWTLWAEVRFYALIGLIFWLARGRSFLWVWAITQTVSTLMLAKHLSGGGQGSFWLWQGLQPTLLAWFTLGLCAWKHRGGERGLALWLAGGVAVLAIMLQIGDEFADDGWARGTEQLMLTLAILGTFATYLFWAPFSRLLSAPVLVWTGLISYPLYLCHERTGMVAITLLSDIGVPGLLTLPIMLAGVFLNAWAVHKLVEGPGKRLLLGVVRPGIGLVERRVPLVRFVHLSDRLTTS